MGPPVERWRKYSIGTVARQACFATDPLYLARAAIDPVAGTAVWLDEADFAPGVLYELQTEDKQVPSSVPEAGSAAVVVS